MRYLGLLIMASACTGAGFLAAESWRERLEILKLLRQMAYHLKGRILYANETLPEALFEVGERFSKDRTGMCLEPGRLFLRVRKRMEKEREAEKTKNDLITNVAHDLRTPLTSIIGYLELLSGKPDMPEEIRGKYINIAYTKARRLEKLIEDLFGFTKLNYGKISMNVGKVDVVKLMGQLLEESFPNFADKNLSYELQSNVPAKVIDADGNLLARLFDNLIGNAIKYGADGKRVVVKILAEEEVVTVSCLT